MSNNEKLIEEAAKAINNVRWSHALPHSSMGGPNWTDSDLARAALAVFEKAHAPTGDEREAIIAAVDAIRNPFATSTREQELLVFEGAEKWAHRSEVSEPSAVARIEQAVAYVRASWLGTGEPTRNTPAGEIIAILQGDRGFAEPQGEPSHEERDAGLSDAHSESYKRGWRAGRASAQGEPSDAQVIEHDDQCEGTYAWGARSGACLCAARAAGNAR